MINNDKLNPLQHGFHSCQTRLLETFHQLARTIDHGASSLIIFLDFAKAFDSVPHQRLLLKLDHIGVRGELQRRIRAFLTDWLQRVVYNGCPSAWTKVTSGVPQGSILLFLMYINDISDNLASPTKLLQMTVRSIGQSRKLLIALPCKKISQGGTPGPKSGSLPWTSANVRPFAPQIKENHLHTPTGWTMLHWSGRTLSSILELE